MNYKMNERCKTGGEGEGVGKYIYFILLKF
jgi:hypothetical protein